MLARIYNCLHCVWKQTVYPGSIDPPSMKPKKGVVEEKVEKEKDAGKASLDVKLYPCVKAQAADKGIFYSGGPAY